MIVDCHTHWIGPQEGDGARDPGTWLTLLDRHGVTHAVALPTVGLGDDCRIVEDNDSVASAASLSGGRMIPFCTMNPNWGPRAEEELVRCLGSLGHRGVKIHPWLQGAGPLSPEMDRVCEVAGSFGVPVVFHDGTPPFSLPSQLALLARRHPRTTIVLGHCGLFEHWREAASAMCIAENLWGCLCGPHLAGLRELIRRCDRERLIWGSDFGFGEADPIGYRLGLLDAAGLGEADREHVLAENPKRLLKLD